MIAQPVENAISELPLAALLQGGETKAAPKLDYLSYIPSNVNRLLEPLVFVHGYSRRAEDQLNALQELSERTSRALIAPCFTKEQHRRYQRLGRGSDGMRADAYFNACLEHAAEQHELSVDRIILLGYSGGAQFSHRYAMIYPQRVARLIAIAAGWYTFPNPEVSFPYGLATARKLRAVSISPEQFLRIPMTVLVGAKDLDTVNLRRNVELDTQQGSTRVERARRWVLAMRMAARLYRVPADISYQEVPGITHSFDEFVARGHLIELAYAAIDDTPVQGSSTEETGSNYAEESRHGES